MGYPYAAIPSTITKKKKSKKKSRNIAVNCPCSCHTQETAPKPKTRDEIISEVRASIRKVTAEVDRYYANNPDID